MYKATDTHGSANRHFYHHQPHAIIIIIITEIIIIIVVVVVVIIIITIIILIIITKTINNTIIINISSRLPLDFYLHISTVTVYVFSNLIMLHLKYNHLIEDKEAFTDGVHLKYWLDVATMDSSKCHFHKNPLSGNWPKT